MAAGTALILVTLSTGACSIVLAAITAFFASRITRSAARPRIFSKEENPKLVA